MQAYRASCNPSFCLSFKQAQVALDDTIPEGVIDYEIRHVRVLHNVLIHKEWVGQAFRLQLFSGLLCIRNNG